MRKLIFTLTLFLITGAFEQKAAVIKPAQKISSIQQAISTLDTLAVKVREYNFVNKRKQQRDEK